jgi:glutathione S-transferase
MGYTVIGTVGTRAARVIWMLEELGLPFEHDPAGPRSPQALQFNPSGKVPVLLVDGQALTDSTAILTFLADRHGAFTAPAGTLERALQDARTFLILDELEGLLWTSTRHSFILPQEQRLPEIKPSLKWEYARNLARLSERFDGPFVMGAKMTVPDFLLTHCLIWAQSAKFPEPGPVLAAYLDRMTSRPAYQAMRAKAVQVSV